MQLDEGEGDLTTRVKENVSHFSHRESPLTHGDESSHNGPHDNHKGPSFE
jgi:hypothetical protein